MKGCSSSSSPCLANTQMLCSSSIPLSIANHTPLLSYGFPCNANSVTNTKRKLSINHSQPNHASWNLVTELERDLKLEDGEVTGMARYKHKCGEGKGVVELLECLEREAIMGADIGKEPTDYNRRAQIFDRSSTVFQALRELDAHTSSDEDGLSPP